MKGYDTNDTICALSTPAGVGAIGVIRLSGKEAILIVNEVFDGKDLNDQPANTIHFGKIIDGKNTVDEVVVALFKSPHSYTGEDIAEISCHGSPFVLQEVLKLLVKKGGRMAKEGEFTLRAFLNGKLDLSQAEAVADLIESDSEASKELALKQLRGGYSSRLKELRGELMNFASMLELELDFSEEDVDFADRTQLKKLIDELLSGIEQMIESFDRGNVLKNGVPVAIIGKPNVGKSTLLNRILQEDKAIVSDIPGTTRDAIEDVVNIGGIAFRFIDTAGLRETTDKVESMGIDRARKKAEAARIVLRLIDVSDGRMKDEEEQKISEVGGRLELNVFNKIDTLDQKSIDDLKEKYGHERSIFISAKEGSGTDELLNHLQDYIAKSKGDGGGVVVSNVRHLEALQHCKEALDRSMTGLNEGISSELVAMDVRQALHYLGEITGEVTTDDLLGNIFSRFCIGK
jgi:tRNA modification GTPase